MWLWALLTNYITTGKKGIFFFLVLIFFCAPSRSVCLHNNAVKMKWKKDQKEGKKIRFGIVRPAIFSSHHRTPCSIKLCSKKRATTTQDERERETASEWKRHFFMWWTFFFCCLVQSVIIQIQFNLFWILRKLFAMTENQTEKRTKSSRDVK